MTKSMNQTSFLFFRLNPPDTIEYNEFTLFKSQLSSVQIPTAFAARLTGLIKYFISHSASLPLKKIYTPSAQLIYLKGGA